MDASATNKQTAGLMIDVLVIHVNSFNRKIDGGYIGCFRNGKVNRSKDVKYMNARQIGEMIAQTPNIQVEFCKV